MNDAGNLQNLNDIVVPGPLAWWPLAPAWYVLLGIGVAALVLLAFYQWRKWQRNRYRRQALNELSSIRSQATADKLQQLPELLKRTALSVWRREEVAALNGSTWHRFLDESAAMDSFCSGAGETLDQLAYGSRGGTALAGPKLSQVLDAAETWLKRHMRRPRDD